MQLVVFGRLANAAANYSFAYCKQNNMRMLLRCKHPVMWENSLCK